MDFILLAILAGGLGSLIGGTQTFIITGFVGILSYVLQACGVNVVFFNDYVLNTLFLPCVIFNGAVVATAYSAKHYDIKGHQTNRALGFTKDIKVVLMGCLGGLVGYLIYFTANKLALPLDTGALSVLIVGTLVRFFLNDDKKMNVKRYQELKELPKKDISFQLVCGFVISALMAYFAYHTKLYTIGFSISAFSLIFGLLDDSFMATHHTTLVAGYAVMQTGDIGMGILFGVVSHLISYFFGEVFNNDCGTHLDPPAVAIALCSLILFVCF